ncbi:MAG: hypothetical protein AAFV72_20115, partial [Cyanobacteria bacterium J06635_1]
ARPAPPGGAHPKHPLPRGHPSGTGHRRRPPEGEGEAGGAVGVVGYVLCSQVLVDSGDMVKRTYVVL